MQPFTVKSVPPHLPSFLKAERGIFSAAAGLKSPNILDGFGAARAVVADPHLAGCEDRLGPSSALARSRW